MDILKCKARVPFYTSNIKSAIVNISIKFKFDFVDSSI